MYYGFRHDFIKTFMAARPEGEHMKKAKTQKPIKYGGLELAPVNSDSALVPTTAQKIVMPKAQEAALAYAIHDNLSCLLIGETGTGKTSAVRYIAKLLGQPYVRVNLNGHITPDELIGTKSASGGSTFFEKGVIIQAMEQGALLVVDELNAAPPDTTFIFHSLLDDDRTITLPNGETVKPHPNFRFFATMNPDYAGTKVLNAAFFDRFPVVVEFGTPKASVEKALVMAKGVNENYADMLLVFATGARQAYTEGRSTQYISTRALLQIAHLIGRGMEPVEAFRVSILPKASKEEKGALMDIFNAAHKTNVLLEGNIQIVIDKRELEKRDENISIVQDREAEAREAARLESVAKQEEREKRRTAEQERDEQASKRQGLEKELKEAMTKLEAYKKLDELITLAAVSKGGQHV